MTTPVTSKQALALRKLRREPGVISPAEGAALNADLAMLTDVLSPSTALTWWGPMLLLEGETVYQILSGDEINRKNAAAAVVEMRRVVQVLRRTAKSIERSCDRVVIVLEALPEAPQCK